MSNTYSMREICDACGMCTDTTKDCDTCGITCVLEDLNELQKLANNSESL